MVSTISLGGSPCGLLLRCLAQYLRTSHQFSQSWMTMHKPLRTIAQRFVRKDAMKELKTPRHRSRATLNDVARMAGVSASTVSSVLAGNTSHRRISEETHAKVHEAATVLRYTPNLLHRSMRRGRTHVISLYNAFRNRVRGDLYMDWLAGAIEQAGGELGYDILVHTNFRRDVTETFEFLNGGFADGLVLFGPTADEPLLPLLRASNLPTVVIGPRYVETELSTVVDNEQIGMEKIAESLLSHGHRVISAVVEMVDGVLDPTGRLNLLKAELVRRGIEFDDRNVIVWDDSGAGAVERYLALQSKPTALFVWHDRNAYRVVEAFEAKGLQVPRDVSVVGYDGLIWPSTSAHIVTSVRAPLDEMAERGVAILHQLISGAQGPISETLSVQFFEGTTIGPASSTLRLQ
jgi:LacI family transcriptional regulator